MKTRNLFVVASALLGAAASGCSGSGMSRGTIHGNVTNDASFTAVSGAVVTAWTVDANGQLSQLTGQTTSDVNGGYDLVVEFAGASIHDVVVKASGSGNFEGEAIVSSSLSDGGTVSAPSMTGQTKVQADLYVQANVDGEWDGSTCSTTELASEVDASVAASLQASADYAGDVAAYAKVVVHGMNAHAKAIADGVSGAIATQAKADAEESLSGSLSASVAQQMVIEVETAKAQAIGAADAQAMTTLGSSASATDVASAQATLVSSIQGSAGSSSAIASAWSSYDAQVKTDLKAAVDAAVSGGSSAVDSVESSLTGAQATLVSSLSASAGDPTLIASAYATFTTTLTSSVQANSTLGTLSSADVTAVANALASLDVN